MKTKIATTFGLALMLTVGIFGTILALGLFSPSTARAVGHGVDITKVTVTPTTPGAASTIAVTFDTSVPLNQGLSLYVTFGSGFGVPATISKDTIVITTSQHQGGSSNPTIDPAIFVCEGDTTTGCSGRNDTQVVLTLGDTVPGTTIIDGLSPAAGHMIQFSPLAGITNPTSAKAHNIWITTSSEPSKRDSSDYTDQSVTIKRGLTLSSTKGPIGSSVTVTGRAFSGTGTATVWIDDGDGGGTYDDGVINGTEQILASGVSVSSGLFTATFTIDSRFSVGLNPINAQDGTGTSLGRTAVGVSPTPSVAYTLRGRVTLDKTSVARGENIQIQLRQFMDGEVYEVKFGGVEADLSDLTGRKTVANNTLDLTIKVPNNTPLGIQEVRVRGLETGTTSVEITGVPTNVNPSTAVANQEVTVDASGFTGGAFVDTIFVGGNAVPTLSSGFLVKTVNMDNSGTMIASFRIPNDSTTRTAGALKIRILGTDGRIGEVDVTIPARELTLSTNESRRGSVVSFTGSGFRAEGTVTISYHTVFNTVTTVAADTAGNITGSFTVPSTAANARIPSANTVTATITCTPGVTGDTCTQTTASAVHKIPGASIIVDPTESEVGLTVKITGTGFPGFVPLTALTIGGVDALGTRAPATNVDGNFEAESVLVPQLGTGTQAVVVRAGGTRATAQLQVLATAVTPVVVPPVVQEPATPEVAFEALISADNLLRVWRFDASTQTVGPDFGWTLFDPRDIPAVQAANTFTSVEDGMFMWIGVNEQTTVTLGGVETTFFPDWTPVTWGR